MLKAKKITTTIFKYFLIFTSSVLFITFLYFDYKEIPIYNLKLAYRFITGQQNYSPYQNLAQKLGFSKNDKLLIIHADDLGLSKSVNKASFKALIDGSVNSASVMMTCEKISEVSEFSKKNPQIDFGIHLTLTSEWKYYKWDGVLESSEIPSLIDENGNL